MGGMGKQQFTRNGSPKSTDILVRPRAGVSKVTGKL